MSNPTIVFSLSAWCPSCTLDPVRAQLQGLGFSSECFTHPSVGPESLPKILEDDVASLRETLINLANEGRDIVVVAHSYGGVVASSAVAGLLKSTRSDDGLLGGVIKIIFVAAFALDKGQSLLEVLGGEFAPWMTVEGNLVYVDGATIWQDLSPEQQKKWNAETLPTSRLAFSGENTYEPWHDVPCAYIVCEQDLALPPAYQELFATKVGGATNTYRLPSSHSPFLSMPDRSAALVAQIIAKS